MPSTAASRRAAACNPCPALAVLVPSRGLAVGCRWPALELAAAISAAHLVQIFALTAIPSLAWPAPVFCFQPPLPQSADVQSQALPLKTDWSAAATVTLTAGLVPNISVGLWADAVVASGADACPRLMTHMWQAVERVSPSCLPSLFQVGSCSLQLQWQLQWHLHLQLQLAVAVRRSQLQLLLHSPGTLR